MTQTESRARTATPSRDIAVYFDPPTHHLFGNKLFDSASNIYAGDNILAPYAAVFDLLTKHGVAVKTADLLPERPDGRRNYLVSFGVPDRLASHSVKKYRALSRREDVVLSAFYAMECPVVEPTLYESLPALSTYFRRVLSWTDTESLLPFTRSKVKVEHFCWPQSFDAVHENLWGRKDRKFLLMMNANKLPRLYVDELYTARLRAVSYFDQFGEVDLYGRGWDREPARVGKIRTPATVRRIEGRAWRFYQRLFPDPLYVAAAHANRGPAKSKSATVSEYRFALCFENSVMKGWMTEKLFDCFFAGTVPVYWGASDVTDWVPAECFIDMRRFRDFRELRSYLHALPKAEEDAYREAARAYVTSERFEPFRLRTWVSRMARILGEDTGLALGGH